MRNKIANLIEVKKVIALLLTFTFIFLSVIRVIDGQQFMSIFTLIIGFYFGQSTVAQSQIRNHELDKTETKIYK
jgi:C4-type Zn-finger protein